jgi:hypothetical protein
MGKLPCGENVVDENAVGVRDDDNGCIETFHCLHQQLFHPCNKIFLSAYSAMKNTALKHLPGEKICQ